MKIPEVARVKIRKSKQGQSAPAYFCTLVDDLSPEQQLRKAKRTGNYRDLESDWPPIYSLQIPAFKAMLRNYEQHVKEYERYYREGRSATIIKEIERIGWAARYGEVFAHFVQIILLRGEYVPFLNPIYFKGKSARVLFWKLADLAARMWRVNLKAHVGGRPAKPDPATAKLHRLAKSQYIADFKSNRYETHPKLCLGVLNKLGWSVTPHYLENLLRPTRCSLLQKRPRPAAPKRHS